MVSTISNAICPFAGRSSLLLFMGMLLLTSCDKEEIKKFSDVPEIQLLDVSQDTIRQYEEVLLIRIMYKDGNGDLGFEDPEQYALFVRDIRLETYDGFYIGPLAPPNANVPIQGNLSIEFPSLFLFGNGAIEQTRFEIKMVDRAGHESNVIETGLVSIIRQ